MVIFLLVWSSAHRRIFSRKGTVVVREKNKQTNKQIESKTLFQIDLNLFFQKINVYYLLNFASRIDRGLFFFSTKIPYVRQ